MSSVRKELPADGLYLGSSKAKSLNHILELDKTKHKCRLKIIIFFFFNAFFILNISRCLFFFSHALLFIIFYNLLIGLHK